MEVGFIGLGSMGSGLARSLIRAGHTVHAWNRSPDPLEALAKDGARAAKTPRDAAATGIVLSMLADDHAVEAVTFRADGILAGLPPGGVHVSMSTIGVELSGRLAQAHANEGQGYVSAPVFGRPEAALAGKVFVCAAGPPTDIERVRPVLESVGQRLFVVGDDPKQANVVKLAGNFMISCVIESLAEASAFAAKAGVDRAAFVDIMTSSLFNAPVYKTYGALLVEGKFTPPGFKLPLGFKDNRLLLQAAEAFDAPLPFASVVRDRFLEAIAAGFGELDWSAVGLIAARAAGVKLPAHDRAGNPR